MKVIRKILVKGLIKIVDENSEIVFVLNWKYTSFLLYKDELIKKMLSDMYSLQRMNKEL